MSIKILKIVTNFSLDDPNLQLLYIAGLALNTIYAPFAIHQALRKIRNILDPKVNQSYSKISIRILKFVIIQATVIITMALTFTGQAIYFQYFRDESAKELDINYSSDTVTKAIILPYYIEFEILKLVSDVLVIQQANEWSIMVYMIAY